MIIIIRIIIIILMIIITISRINYNNNVIYQPNNAIEQFHVNLSHLVGSCLPNMTLDLKNRKDIWRKKGSQVELEEDEGGSTRQNLIETG